MARFPSVTPQLTPRSTGRAAGQRVSFPSYSPRHSLRQERGGYHAAAAQAEHSQRQSEHTVQPGARAGSVLRGVDGDDGLPARGAIDKKRNV